MGPGPRENGSMSGAEKDAPCAGPARETGPRGWDPKPLVRGFLIRAFIWSVAFGVAHLFGLRAYTSILSGTAHYGMVQRVLGVVYLVLYAGLVYLVPVLVIAALLVKAAGWIGASPIGGNHPNGTSNQPSQRADGR
jgi:hypothetical protein